MLAVLSRFRWLGLVSLWLGGLSSCDCKGVTPGGSALNHPPVAVAGSDRQVLVSSAVVLDGSLSSDVDNDPLTFAWTQTGGGSVSLSDTTAAQPGFTAPAAADLLTFELTVKDGEASATDSVTIHVVTAITNQPPVADAGLDRTVTGGVQLVLDGAGSTDPDGDALTFAWSQLAGPTVTLNAADTAQPWLTSPEVAATETLVFSLTVNDGELDSAPDAVAITVEPGSTTNLPPVANAGLDQTVDMSTAVTLDGTGSTDPESDPLTFAWAQASGPTVALSDPTAASPSFTAPVVLADTDLTFSLAVNDGTQDSLPDSVTIHVRHVNRPPFVVAVAPAAPHSVSEGASLSVQVTFADPDGDSLTFTDDCSDYSYVTCSYAENLATVTVAPGFDVGPALASVTLTATDPQLLTGSQPLAITIIDVNRAPVAAFTWSPDPPAAGVYLLLNDLSTDPDSGDTHTCLWTSATATLEGDVTSCDSAAVAPLGCAETHDVNLTVTDAGGLTGTVTHTLATPAPGPYVRKRLNGCATSCGSQAEPWCTIQEALAGSAGGTAYPLIYVAASSNGPYNDSTDWGVVTPGPITMISGVSLQGGYDASDWTAAPDRAAHATVIETTDVHGLSFDGVTDVSFAGFQVLSRYDGSVGVATKANLSLIDCDDSVSIADNVIDATDLAPAPTHTVGIDLLGTIGAVLDGNAVSGGNGSATASAIRYQAVDPAHLFTGTIVDHALADGNFLRGGASTDSAALRFLGPVGVTAVITGNDIDGGTGSTLAQGILFASSCDMVLGGNHSIAGGAGAATNGVRYTNIGDGETAIIDGELAIVGGSGARSTGVHAGNPGTLVVRNTTIDGGTGATLAIGVNLSGTAQPPTAGPLSATLEDNDIVGGHQAESRGVNVNAAAAVVISGGTTIGGMGATTGYGVVGIGPTRLTVTGATVTGRTAGVSGWAGSGIGLSLSEGVDLTVVGSQIVGGAAQQGIGILYQHPAVGVAPSTFTVGGADPASANVISGALLDAVSGVPVMGGMVFYGMAVSTLGAQPTALSQIRGNTAIYGGAPSSAASPGGSPSATGISITRVDRTLVEGNTVIQGCMPSCAGAAPATRPFGTGIYIEGASKMDDVAVSGGIADNGRIAGGAVANTATGSPWVAGLRLAGQPGGAGSPNVLAVGNTLLGNPTATTGGVTTAHGVRVEAGTLQLGTSTSGNPRVEGGPASQTSVGVDTAPAMAIKVTIVNNAELVGNSLAAVSPATAYGIFAESTAGGLANNLTVEQNPRVWGGYASLTVAGIHAFNLGGGPLADNNIFAGANTPSSAPNRAETTGLDISSTSGAVVIERNLIEGCGLYDLDVDPPTFDAACAWAGQSTGARIAGALTVSFWNNRVFGGHARFGLLTGRTGTGIRVAAVDLTPVASAIANPAEIVAANYMNAQGNPGAGMTAAAFFLGGPNGPGTGLGAYLINNILDNGQTSPDRYHVFEYAFGDVTDFVVLNNDFVPDLGGATTAVAYHEDLGASVVDWKEAVVSVGCSAAPACLDDTAGATNQTVLTHKNFEGDLVLDPGFSGDAKLIRVVPRNLPLKDFETTAAGLSDSGYSFQTGNAYGLAGPEDDFEGDHRALVPDIGHDER